MYRNKYYNYRRAAQRQRTIGTAVTVLVFGVLHALLAYFFWPLLMR